MLKGTIESQWIQQLMKRVKEQQIQQAGDTDLTSLLGGGVHLRGVCEYDIYSVWSAGIVHFGLKICKRLLLNSRFNYNRAIVEGCRDLKVTLIKVLGLNVYKDEMKCPVYNYVNALLMSQRNGHTKAYEKWAVM